MDREFLIQTEHLNVYYKNRKRGRVQVLKDINFDLRPGEILGLVGESGSGKSTLAKTILGLVKDYDGTITTNTQKPQMVFQDPYSSLNPVKKIGWIMEEPLRLADKNNSEKEPRRQKVLEMIKKMSLDTSLISRYPRQLSGGQRQRVSIGTALILNPELIIADEPVSALDVTVQAQILQLLKQIQEETGVTILFISHDLRVVYQMCDRVAIMQDGRIIETGTRDEIYFNPREEYTKKLLDAAGA